MATCEIIKCSMIVLAMACAGCTLQADSREFRRQGVALYATLSDGQKIPSYRLLQIDLHSVDPGVLDDIGLVLGPDSMTALSRVNLELLKRDGVWYVATGPDEYNRHWERIDIHGSSDFDRRLYRVRLGKGAYRFTVRSGGIQTFETGTAPYFGGSERPVLFYLPESTRHTLPLSEDEVRRMFGDPDVLRDFRQARPL